MRRGDGYGKHSRCEIDVGGDCEMRIVFEVIVQCVLYDVEGSVCFIVIVGLSLEASDGVSDLLLVMEVFWVVFVCLC